MIREAAFVLVIIFMSFNDANCIGYYVNYSYASDEIMSFASVWTNCHSMTLCLCSETKEEHVVDFRINLE